MSTAGATAVGDPAEVPVRDAATVVLLRDGADGLEVWMLVRVRQMVFAGGMAVFPGGRVDPDDAALPLLDESVVARTAQRFGCDEPLARALLGAAVRETFEETGVLLGRPAPDLDESTLAGHRAEVEAGRLPFGELLREHGVALDAGALRPWSRWVTPPGEVRRYDTRFFVGTLPPDAQPRDVTTESSEAHWVAVEHAIEQAQRGERGLLPPTLITLTQLARHERAAEVIAAADERVIEAIRPDVRRTDDGGFVARLPDGVELPLPAHLFL